MVARVKRPGAKQRTGAFGEEVTAQYLLARGDEILDRNWRIREGEIDLVSLSSDGAFHFIEVKTRSSVAFGHPFEAINNDKAHRMQRLALAWLLANKKWSNPYRIDCAAVIMENPPRIDYRAGVI